MCETGIEVDLPEDFDAPFEDEESLAPESASHTSASDTKEEPVTLERR